jgi:NTE family protein
MKAFVLSGGGNRGPLQLGAIKSLLQHGVVPDMIVGTSAGAINGLFLAIDPSAKQAEHGADLWRDAGTRKLFSNSTSRTLYNAVRGRNYLADNVRLRAYMQRVAPPHVRMFGDLSMPFYVTVAHLFTQSLYVYGDEKDANVFDAVILSAAVPGFFPPRMQNGELFTDGGTASNMAIDVAVAHGATEVWAIDLACQPDPRHAKTVRGAFAISTFCGVYLLYQKTLRELELALDTPDLTLHHIPIYAHQNIALGDFSRVDAMMKDGAKAALAYLNHPEPNTVRYPHEYTPDELPAGPPGSRPFIADATRRRMHSHYGPQRHPRQG